jgi:hypothetical protein
VKAAAGCCRCFFFEFVSTSSLSIGWGWLCQVLEIYIATVYRGFGGFRSVVGLDRVLAGGGLLAISRGAIQSLRLRLCSGLRQGGKRRPYRSNTQAYGLGCNRSGLWPSGRSRVEKNGDRSSSPFGFARSRNDTQKAKGKKEGRRRRRSGSE